MHVSDSGIGVYSRWNDNMETGEPQNHDLVQHKYYSAWTEIRTWDPAMEGQRADA